MPTVGCIEPFDINQPSTWDAYTERLKFFFEANGITENDMKRATFLSACGLPTLTIAKSLVSPKSLSDVSYDYIVGVLKCHFIPKPSVIYQRFHFQRRLQRDGEGVAAYVADLRRLADDCNFRSNLEERLRDQLVCGLKDEDLQKRLLAHSDPDLDSVIREAIAAESASSQAKDIRSAHGTHAAIADAHHVRKGRNRRPPKVTEQNPAVSLSRTHCAGCGGEHFRSQCPFRNAKCRHCSRVGHIERVCRSKNTGNVPQSSSRMNGPKKNVSANTLRRKTSDCSPDAYQENSILFITSERSKKTVTTVMLNGMPCRMEVDSGSDFTIISMETYQSLWQSNGPPIEPCCQKIIDFQGHAVPLAGTCSVDVSYGHRKGRLRLCVAKGKRVSLLGNDWFNTLGIRLVGVHHTHSDPISSLVEEFSDIFENDVSAFGAYSGPPATLHLDPSVAPIQLKARRVPIALMPKIDAEIDRLIRHGILEPTENPEWTTPVVPIIKQNGEVRLCADYKCTINKALRQHPYPIPQVERLLNTQAGGKIYAKLDLANAYLQIRVDDKSADAQTIVTHRGAFRVKRLQYGVCTAPGIFQSCMEKLLRDIPGVTPYFDDILVKADSLGILVERLREIFSRFRSCGLRVRKEKCIFGVRKVEFLGYCLDESGIHPTQAKSKAIHEAPVPRDKKELQAFLGLVNFYHNFLKDKANVAEPLHQLLRANAKWSWTPVHEEAFQKVKQLLSDESFLVGFDAALPIILTCDASQYGIGAVLAHRTREGREAPVAFHSRTMTPTERNYAQVDREALAVVSAVKKFHDYLYGHRFTIITDHKPLLGLFAPSKATPQILSPRLLRWTQLLRAYDFELLYRPGSAISHADGLSRLPAPSPDLTIPPLAEVSFLEELPRPPLRASDIASMSARDPIISRVLNWAWKGWPSSSVEEHFLPFLRRQHEISCHRGCLLWGNRVVIPEAGRNILLDELHLGHPGIVRMKGLARSYVWWPGIDKQIEERVRKCQACQETRHVMPKAPTHPWEVTRSPWSRLHLDFAGPFQGRLFLIVVDSYSKWLEVLPVATQSSKVLISELRRLFATHGLPDTVVSDNGSAFTSSEFADFLRQNAIRHARIAPYHPSSNGQAERMVQTFKEALRHMTSGDLDQRLAAFLLSQHITPSATTGRSPAELLMNRHLRSRLDRLHPDLTSERQEEIGDSGYSKKERVFDVNQPVSVRNFSSEQKWTPAVITESTGPVSYKAQLADGRVVHRHVDHILKDDTRSTDREEPGTAPAPVAAQEPEPPDVAQEQTTAASEVLSPSSRPSRNRRPPGYLKDYVV